MFALSQQFELLIEEELMNKYNLIGIKVNSYLREIVDGERKDYPCDLYGETVILNHILQW